MDMTINNVITMWALLSLGYFLCERILELVKKNYKPDYWKAFERSYFSGMTLLIAFIIFTI